MAAMASRIQLLRRPRPRILRMLMVRENSGGNPFSKTLLQANKCLKYEKQRLSPIKPSDERFHEHSKIQDLRPTLHNGDFQKCLFLNLGF